MKNFLQYFEFFEALTWWQRHSHDGSTQKSCLFITHLEPNLDKLPATGSYVIALPMKIKEGSGAPLRIIAIIPYEKRES